eukprot:gene33793-21867_t
MTVAGMLLSALVISLVAEKVQKKFNALKAGAAGVVEIGRTPHTMVWCVEVGHTVIVGWSGKVAPLIQQLAVAMESDGPPHTMVVCVCGDGGGVVVVEAMETDLKQAELRLLGTSVADIDNREVVKLMGGDHVETISSRQAGLSQILASVLGFEGSEFYFKRWPELDGVAFGDACFRFADAVPLGNSHPLR